MKRTRKEKLLQLFFRALCPNSDESGDGVVGEEKGKLQCRQKRTESDNQSEGDEGRRPRMIDSANKLLWIIIEQMGFRHYPFATARAHTPRGRWKKKAASWSNLVEDDNRRSFAVIFLHSPLSLRESFRKLSQHSFKAFLSHHKQSGFVRMRNGWEGRGEEAKKNFLR